jgi:hypothetical protein
VAAEPLAVKESTAMPNKSDNSPTDLEWEARTLCSDEDCIGVIGPEGRCLECGRVYDGDLPENIDVVMPPSEEEDGAGVENGVEADASDGVAPASETERQDADDEWAHRRLCEDENCIGVIGPDGRCMECGRKVGKS